MRPAWGHITACGDSTLPRSADAPVFPGCGAKPGDAHPGSPNSRTGDEPGSALPERPPCSGRGRGIGRGGPRGWVSPRGSPGSAPPAARRRKRSPFPAASSPARLPGALASFARCIAVFPSGVFNVRFSVTSAHRHTLPEKSKEARGSPRPGTPRAPRRAGGRCGPRLARRRRPGSGSRPPVLAASAALGTREPGRRARVQSCVNAGATEARGLTPRLGRPPAAGTPRRALPRRGSRLARPRSQSPRAPGRRGRTAPRPRPARAHAAPGSGFGLGVSVGRPRLRRSAGLGPRPPG